MFYNHDKTIFYIFDEYKLRSGKITKELFTPRENHFVIFLFLFDMFSIALYDVV